MGLLDDDLNVGDNHPLTAEIASLRLAVSRFQDEAHSSSVKLQRQSLESTKALERASQIERENDALRSEIAILRANPHPDASHQAHPAVLQVQQLTLSLRRLSDKLSLTEDALLTRTTELTHAMSEATKAKYAAEGAYELAARTRGREEAGKIRELELEWKVKAADEAAKMSDLVVNEYADLVRALNTKTGKRPTTHTRSNSSAPSLDAAGDSTLFVGIESLSESLSQGKFGIQRLLAEFSSETEKLQAEILKLHAEVETAEAKSEAEKKVSEQSRVELANALFEIQKLKLEDNAAAKMVSRYMKFSQKSTDSLQDAMTALKTRHSATINTLSSQLYDVSGQLRSSDAEVDRLRTALDELGGDILKETYGRRREVALRIRMVNREEKIKENLERWLLRAEETLKRGEGPTLHHEMIQSAREILSLIDGPSASSGSLARLMLARSAVEELTKELEVETAKKLHLESLLAQVDPIVVPASVQDAMNKNPNEIINVRTSIDISPTELIPEDKDYEQPLRGPPSIDHPPSNDTNVPVSYTDDVEDIVDEETPLQLIQEDLEPLPPSPHSVQAESQSAPMETTSTLVDISDPHTPLIAEKETFLDETTINSTSNAPVFKTPDHDPITPADWSSEGQTPEQEALTESPIPPNPTNPSIHDHQPPSPAPLEQSLTRERSPSLEVTRSPSPENVPSRRNSLIKEQTSPSPVPTPADNFSLPLPSAPERPPNPLLEDLIKVSHRYDDLQRAFRDCHLALETLKASMSPTSPNSTISLNNPDILRTALERLNDYTEDARVELEIRIADESLMARGFETLLSVPGALSSPSSSSRSALHDDFGGPDSTPTQSEVERQIQDFISGEDPAVEKALVNFTRKLDDIQHDIAALKHAIHDPVLSPTAPSTAPAANGSGWSSWILNSPASGPVSGSGSSPGPAPTFGNVMTTPRLRHSPSLNFQTQPKKGYLGGGSKDAFAALGLKVPMPSYVHVPEAPQRSRTVSTMYMLGLGARRPSASGTFASPTQHSKKPPPKLHGGDDADVGDDASEPEDDDSDIE